MSWEMVDECWGRKAVDFATVAEPSHCREYVFIEYPDPEAYARGIASTGPAYEAMQNIGEDVFLERAAELAREHVVDGVPLRGQIELFGYIGTKP